MSSNFNPMVFWAKLSPKGKKPQRFHPLICHMIDVASVAKALWCTILSDDKRRELSNDLGCSESAAARWITFWAGLHDLGKANPTFQGQDASALDLLRSQGYQFSLAVSEIPHGVVTTAQLRSWLPSIGLSTEVSCRVATLLGGHHGTFPSNRDVIRGDSDKKAMGDVHWTDARQQLALALFRLFEVPHDDIPRHLDNATAMFLAGLVSISDWIGSEEHCFPLSQPYPLRIAYIDLSAYAVASQSMAREALSQLGWAGWIPRREILSFSELFSHIKCPYPVQREVMSLADRLDSPSLVVIEVPMGEGKTEAAMYLADRWGATLGQRGCYFALPTQATSNQMFGRVWKFLKHRYSADTVNLQLLHGHASLSALFQQLRKKAEAGKPLDRFEPDGIEGEIGYDGASPGVIAAEWFTYRKRGLLAPFGVGTVDQALLAALQTKHVFVRLFGLAGKTVIVDEVHAYDTYMSALLERLLEWLGALHSSVVLLSATLPRDRRDLLLQAYAKGAGYELPVRCLDAPYPRISWVSSTYCSSRNVEISRRTRRKVKIGWIDGSLPITDGASFELGERLRSILADGGCAAVICNTVSRAQKLYLALKSYFPDTADDGEAELDLLHARYLFSERNRREKRSLVRFGKPGDNVELEDGVIRPVQRPRRAVLISTQIIEQSLDVDFDLIVSDFAPVDLLLQRSGRSHRHDRKDRHGPDVPTMWILGPKEENSVPVFESGFDKVYDEHVLLRSWLKLRGRNDIRIPEEVEDLVEFVYGEISAPSDLTAEQREKWEKTMKSRQAELESDRQEAEERWLKPVSFNGALWRLIADPKEEDAPNFHRAHQALTRLCEPTVQVVVLRDSQINVNAAPSEEEAVSLLSRSISISDRRIVFDILAMEPPSGWSRCPLLRHHRLLQVDSENRVAVGNHYLRFDIELGLVVD